MVMTTKTIKKALYQKIMSEGVSECARHGRNVSVVQILKDYKYGRNVCFDRFLQSCGIEDIIDVNALDRFKYNWSKLWSEVGTAIKVSPKHMKYYSDKYLLDLMSDCGTSKDMDVLIKLYADFKLHIADEELLVVCAMLMDRDTFISYVLTKGV